MGRRDRQELLTRLTGCDPTGAALAAATTFTRELYAAGDDLHRRRITRLEFQVRMDSALLAAVEAIAPPARDAALGA